jgi:hypothetical protein
LVVGQAVGDDPDPPSGPARVPQRAETFGATGRQLGHASAVVLSHLVGWLGEVERLANGGKEAVH